MTPFASATRGALVLGFLTGLPGCGAADAPHYYTLVPPAQARAVAKDEPVQIELLPVEVPSQVDTALMVVREGATDVVPVTTRRWVAPLHEELRTAFSSGVCLSLGARDVTGAGATGPAYRIKVIVRRFDSLLGASASIVAVWTVRETGSDTSRTLTCETRALEPATGSFDALAAGHQRAVLTISKEIADTILDMRAHPGATACAMAP